MSILDKRIKSLTLDCSPGHQVLVLSDAYGSRGVCGGMEEGHSQPHWLHPRCDTPSCQSHGASLGFCLTFFPSVLTLTKAMCMS